jgi:hypothetical protein
MWHVKVVGTNRCNMFGERGQLLVRGISEKHANILTAEHNQSIKNNRHEKMIEVATEYFTLLRKENSNPEELNDVLNKLNELSETFSDDPAFVALLRLEREVREYKNISLYNAIINLNNVNNINEFFEARDIIIEKFKFFIGSEKL